MKLITLLSRKLPPTFLVNKCSPLAPKALNDPATLILRELILPGEREGTIAALQAATQTHPPHLGTSVEIDCAILGIRHLQPKNGM